MTYEEFLKEKIAIASSSGFSVAENDIHPILKPHQKDAVKWAIAGGCRAVFASFGLATAIHLHHIVTRAANHKAINKVWNWCALIEEEHRELHQYGERAFLQKYPHLAGKFRRAHEKAHRLYDVR